MTDEGDEGARVGLWVALGVVGLLLFGLIGGLAFRQLHKHAPTSAVAQVAPVAALAAPSTSAIGTPAVVAETLLDGPVSGQLLSKLYFDSGSANLPNVAANVVMAAATALGKAPEGSKLVLSGFHDASGDPLKNAELAKQRAKAVREALTAAGVDINRVGMRKPEVTTGGGPANEARRVEIRLVP
jgi:outer membrane protein OmpA-like peptidoglycan-associated protein